MERSFLDNFGLEKTQIDSVLNEHSKDIGEKVTEINNLRSQIQGFETTIEELKGKLDTANSTINTLKNSNKDNESLQQKISEYQNQIKEMQASFDLERKNNVIINSLRENNFIDPDLALHLIDADKVVKNNDGTYSGLAEQIESIVSNEKYKYLLNTPSGDNNTAAIPDQIDRGGYNPYEGTKTSPSVQEFLIGEVIGREAEAKSQTVTESAENFWDSVKI